MSKRQCGDCQACCKLLPMQRDANREIGEIIASMIELGLAEPRDFSGMINDFDKPAGQRCRHQKHHVGCKIYQHRPFGCRMWSCRWLLNDDTADIGRPDRSGCVIDLVPDIVGQSDRETGESVGGWQAVQIWIDPKTPDAWKAPAIRAFIMRRAEEGQAAIIRYGDRDGFVLFAPPLSPDGEWHEIRGNVISMTLEEKWGLLHDQISQSVRSPAAPVEALPSDIKTGDSKERSTAAGGALPVT